MEDEVNGDIPNVSDKIRTLFDNEFIEITKHGKKVPFSSDIILEDLFESGISPLRAIDIIFELRPHLYRGIDTRKIIQVINQIIQQKDMKQGFLKGSYLEPIYIENEDGETQLFNFKFIRQLIEENLINYNYSSKTFKAIVDEFHRIVINMRSSTIQINVLENIIPSAISNVIGINPFISNRYEEDYHNVIKLSQIVLNTWNIIPEDEKPVLLVDLFESMFKIILIAFEYLPGHTLESTVYQVNQLVAHLSSHEDIIISPNELHLLGKLSKKISVLTNSEYDDTLLKQYEWPNSVEILVSVIEDLINTGSISWLIVADNAGNEVYSKFIETKYTKHRSLIGMAISGVQSLMNELTDKSIKQIEQDEGSIILIERRDLFSVICLVDQPTSTIRNKLNHLAEYIQKNLSGNIKEFNGSVNEIHDSIEYYIDEHFRELLF